MNRCGNCGEVFKDTDIFYWKCKSCSKVFKLNYLKLKNINTKKEQMGNRSLTKCPSCSSVLDDGTEKIAYKCRACGHTVQGNLKSFVSEDADICDTEKNVLDNPNLIKCPKCGKAISKRAKMCVHCGKMLVENSQAKKVCADCGREIPGDVSECPFCGCPNTRINKKSIIIGIICVIVGLCLGILSLTKKHYKPDQEKTVNSETMETIVNTLDVDLKTEKSDIEYLINNFFEELQSGNLDNTQKYLAEECDYVKSNPFGLSSKENVGKLLEHYEFSLIDLKVNDEGSTAFVNIEINHPDQTDLLDAAIANFSLNEENSMENGFMDRLSDNDLKYIVTNGSLNLIKVDDTWKINVDDFYISCIFLGITEETSFEKMAENQKKQAEKESYIKEMIDLVDYNVGMVNGYLGTVPGIKDISIKNNGDKQIDSLTLGVDFLDETGNTLFSKEITVLGILDGSISPGYSWKMEKDKFFELENIPDNIDLNRVVVSINDAELSNVKSPSQKTEEDKYIEQYVEITNYYIGMKSGYRGKEPGISDIAIKNNGDKTIAELTITVYFQDETGKNIAEDSFIIIGGYWGGDVLKANYSWKMENDRYYSFDNLADEVDISRNSVKVTEIKFD